MNELKEYLKDLQKRGYTIERTRNDHIKIRNREGRIVAYTGGTPSDYRSVKNLKARIRKAEKT